MPVYYRTAEDLWNFPLIVLQKLFDDPLRGETHRLNFKRCLRHGLHATTCFSGYDAPQECMRLVSVALGHLYGPESRISFVFSKACDFEEPPLRVLKETSAGKTCVFKDLRARVPAAHLEAMEKMVPRECSSLRDRQAAFLRIERYVLAHSSEIFNLHSKAPCVVHGGLCSCQLSRAEQRAALGSGGFPLSINIAGSICRGWSTVGKRAGHGHESDDLHTLWREERASASRLDIEDAFFHECVTRYPARAKLSEPLRGTHFCHSITANPQSMGHATKRPRVLSFCGSRHSVLWLGPEDVQRDFDRIFKSECYCDGDDYFVSKAAEILADQHLLAERRKLFVDASASDVGYLRGADLLALLPGATQSRWYDHDLLAAEVEGPYLADVMQHVPLKKGRSSPGPLWPTQLTNGLVWSWRLGRFATKMEHLQAQGLISLF